MVGPPGDRAPSREGPGRLLPALLLLALLGAFAAWCVRPAPPAAAPIPPPAAPRAPEVGGRGSPPPPREGLEVPVLARKAVTLLPGLHLLGETYPNAAYVVETAEGLVLVDTCKEPDARPLLNQMRRLGLDPSRLRRILITHSHVDHSMGAAELRRATGAAVCASGATAAVLRAGGPEEAIFSIFAMPRVPHRTEVDVVLADGEEFRLGEATFRVIATPGHTAGDLCYLLELRGRRILFTGDVLMSLSDEGPLTGTGTYSAALEPRFGGNAVAFEASLRKLLALPLPDLVLPGHPAADPEPESPRLPEWRWRRLLEDGIAELQRTRERILRDGPDFLDGTPRELLPGLHAAGLFGGVASYAVRDRDGGVVLVNAPGDGGFPALLRENLRAAGAGEALPSAVLLTTSWKQARGGLQALLAAAPCVVYAPAEGLEEVRRSCPPGTDLRAAETLPGDSGIAVTVLPVRGAASPAVSYLFHREGKWVLATPGIPDPVTLEPEGGPGRWSGRTPVDATAVLASLEPLGKIEPDLWLPLRPLMAQNANLYDADWNRILEHTRSHLATAVR